MKDIKAIYTEKYFDDFVSKLSELSGEYKSILLKILNHKAYGLDSEIWQHASKSKLIREYFDDAGIDKQKGNGLRSLISRARSLNGTFDLDSKTGQGTLI